MIPTLEELFDKYGSLTDILIFDVIDKVYEDLVLLRSLSDLNEHQKVDRVLFIQKYFSPHFDYLLDDSEFRSMNKIYSNLNIVTYFNSQNNEFKLKPFINEEQLKSLLAIKKVDKHLSYDPTITSKNLADINKTQKRLVTKLDKLYNRSKKENEYVRLGEKISYTKLEKLWKYLYNEIQYYNLTNQLISYVALEKEYAWAFLNELFYLIELYLKAFKRQKKTEHEFEERLNAFIQTYVISLLIDIRLPTVRLYIIRHIVDACEKEPDNQKRIKLIEESIKKYRYVKEQIERFGNGLKEELSIATLSIEQNKLESKIDHYKDYFYPREKTKYNNIEYNVSLFFKAVDALKK
ncbi:ACP synthase [Mammaliicoccus sciuri]|uniref:ACP synthase n=1 Tax=Mammaliicoccus sciuri TaxID=1296 RepID=UPI001FB4F25D|nr:ACP synthase [Mammaliicoccus sciuri]MCJ0957413.1 ACP synthase [Mammaliicoccus sciuri]MCJ1776099.1 ACP synthase [Mammaliicoccus sciuri]